MTHKFIFFSILIILILFKQKEALKGQNQNKPLIFFPWILVYGDLLKFSAFISNGKHFEDRKNTT